MNKMNDLVLKISTDFCKSPGARYPEEGDFSGQEFRENVLFPIYQEAKRKGVGLIVDLDGTSGLGTSFLEESFGGLIRVNKLDYNDVINTISFVSVENPDYIEEILGDLKDAYEKCNQ